MPTCIVVLIRDRPTYDRQPISFNAHGMFLLFLENTLLTHNYSDFLFQLCHIRGSFQCFLKTFSTVTLAVVLDAVLGYHDGNLQSCDLL